MPPSKIGGSSPQETLSNLKTRASESAGLLGTLEARRARNMSHGMSSPLASISSAQETAGEIDPSYQHRPEKAQSSLLPHDTSVTEGDGQ